MHTVADLLDAACVAQGGISGYALAKRLGTEPPNVSRWKAGRVIPGNDYLVRIAQLIGIDPQYAIACVEVHRTENPTPTYQYWKRVGEREQREASKKVGELLEQQAEVLEDEAKLLRRRARGVASVLLAAGAGLWSLSPSPAEACPLYARVEGGSVYILLNRRRRRISARYRPDIGHGYRPPGGERRRFLSWLNPPGFPAAITA